MSRYSYAGGAADFVFDVAPNGYLRLRPATLLVFAAENAGARVTDLRLNGQAVTTIPVDATGQVPDFQGPDGFDGDLWAATGPDRPRIRLVSNAESSRAEAAAATATAAAESIANLAGSISGYQDHGNVSGEVTIDPDIGTHVLDATGPTTLTIGTADNGVLVTVLVVTGAEDVGVTGSLDAELTDGAFATFGRIRGVWVLAGVGGGGSGIPGDGTPPTAPTTVIASSVTATSVLLTASGGSGGVDHYEYSIDSGTTWHTSGAFTGLDASTTYVGWAVAVDTAGNVSTGHADTSFDTAADLTNHVTDAFTGADGALVGRVTDTGGKTWANYTATNLGSTAPTISGNKITGTGGAIAITQAVANVSASVAYDLTGLADYTGQVRIFGRTSAGSFDGIDLRISKQTAMATLAYEGAGNFNTKLDEEMPLTGTIGIKFVGTTATFYANGRQMGEPVTLAGAAGTYYGVAFAAGAKADTFYCSPTAETFVPLQLTAADTFTAANGTAINGRTSTTGEYVWTAPKSFAGDVAALKISGNAAVVSDTGIGAGSAAIKGPIFDAQDVTLTAVYDVSGASGDRVRVTARAKDTAQLEIQVGIKGDGVLYYKTSWAGAETTLDTGQPTTGTLTVEVAGAVAKVKIGGVQVGADIAIAAGTANPYIGLGLGNLAKVLDFTAVWS